MNVVSGTSVGWRTARRRAAQVRLKRTLSLLTLVLCLGIARVQAQVTNDVSGDARGPIITSAYVTLDQQTIVITGSDFGRLTPGVMLGSTPLAGVTVNAAGTGITAALPPGTPAATYELLVTRTSRPARSESAYLVVGTQGPKGDAGPQGLPGPPGPQGVPGPQGLGGPAGPTGPQGAKGDTGSAGPAGQQGPQGAVGLQGATGVTGPAGPQGPKGDTGATGATGTEGPAGGQGPQGLPGPTGNAGPQGPAGAAGSSGISLVGANNWFLASGSWSIPNNTLSVLPGSGFTAITTGGPLEINVTLGGTYLQTLNQFSCMPVIDGVWAGRFGFGPGFQASLPYVEGIEYNGTANFLLVTWSRSRVYSGISAGTHVFDIRCWATGGPNAPLVGNFAVNSLTVKEIR